MLEAMAATWTRIRFQLMLHAKLLRIVTGVLLVALLIFIYRWYSASSLGSVRYGPKENIDFMSGERIHKHMEALDDTRPLNCLQKKYGGINHDKVSIILDFSEEEFFNLKLTIASIIAHTPESMYEEIIVIDDATQKNHIKEHVSAYLGDQKFHKVKAFTSDQYHGNAMSRFKASQMAVGSILVFLSSDVVVNKGWLEPLVENIRINRHLIAVPHFDTFLENIRFHKIDEKMVNIFSWTLSTIHMVSYDEVKDTLKTPVMRGNAFAVDKQFFETIGNFDLEMNGRGGHNLELSLRAWLCGGEIFIIPCSRVAVHRAMAPIEINSAKNIRRISELWLDKYKSHVYRQRGIDSALPESEEESLAVRKGFFRKRMECHDFEWYITNVATEILVPSDNPAQFGKLSANTAYCVRGNPSSKDVEMVLCRPHIYDAEMIFELSAEGQLINADRCLTRGSNKFVELLECKATGKIKESDKNQKWKLQKNGQITAKDGITKCLAHLPIRNEQHILEHYLVMDYCKNERHFLWSFIKS